MTQETSEQTPPTGGKLFNYKTNTGELFEAFLFYAMGAESWVGAVGSIPSDQQLITDGIRIAVQDVPELHPLIGSDGQLSVEARGKLDKHRTEGVIVEKNGAYQFGDPKKISDILKPRYSMLITPAGIDALSGAAKKAHEAWSPQNQ